MQKIWRYALAHDSGLVPCVEQQVPTPCMYTPKIRAGAKGGDWARCDPPRWAERTTLMERRAPGPLLPILQRLLGVYADARKPA